jgi:hypothetical protein
MPAVDPAAIQTPYAVLRWFRGGELKFSAGWVDFGFDEGAEILEVGAGGSCTTKNDARHLGRSE